MKLKLNQVTHDTEEMETSTVRAGRTARATMSMDDLAVVHLGRLVCVTKWIKEALKINLNPETLLMSLRVRDWTIDLFSSFALFLGLFNRLIYFDSVCNFFHYFNSTTSSFLLCLSLSSSEWGDPLSFGVRNRGHRGRLPRPHTLQRKRRGAEREHRACTSSLPISLFHSSNANFDSYFILIFFFPSLFLSYTSNLTFSSPNSKFQLSTPLSQVPPVGRSISHSLSRVLHCR